jgi:hypothetical protein
VNLTALFNAVDAKPFRPFAIELVSGNRVEVAHPDNIFILPNRQTVHHIQVFGPGPTYTALIWPEGIVGLSYDGNGAGRGPA